MASKEEFVSALSLVLQEVDKVSDRITRHLQDVQAQVTAGENPSSQLVQVQQDVVKLQQVRESLPTRILDELPKRPETRVDASRQVESKAQAGSGGRGTEEEKVADQGQTNPPTGAQAEKDAPKADEKVNEGDTVKGVPSARKG